MEIIAKEADEQKSLFKWAELMAWKYPELKMMFAIPNGGSRHIAEAVNLKKQGVKAGVPDILLPVARHNNHGMFIEMKRRTNGKISNVQEEWITDLMEQGYRVVICEGFDVARQAIEKYLKPEFTPEQKEER